ncbi:hypothetical protein [Methylobacterium dankookense]|uniref:Uncharacterized protein n=1 Tax=Methylobacterium dankookense TaxID=560405 RepID=A0A564G1G0_9HYPH|nr:hypothetical protein [Methylobacterium dankookense]GJD55525.1 hypothetical protein IFDJLNFL_1412 [Methylobacterium dankookense]VUF14309.1 hypothetical protein MTDSW087_04028 [Methylobacterium dankookense]
MTVRATSTCRWAAALSALMTVLAVPAGAQTDAGPYGFSVQVSLSPKALKKLTDISESVTVRSFYYGTMERKPTRADIKRARAEGREPDQIEITGDTATLPAAGGTAAMAGRGVPGADVAAIGKNPVKVNINVFSARKAAPDNLLDCDLFDDAVAVARAKPIAITCRLIGEAPE